MRLPLPALLLAGILTATILSSCTKSRHPGARPSRAPEIRTTIETAPSSAPASPPATSRGSRSVALTFNVDPKQSVGTIETILDPDGVALGPKPGHCQCPLRGTISANLIENADGTRFLHITDVSLATTTPAHLHYEWSVLLGDIHSTIPAGQLKITDHQLTGPFSLDANNRFHGTDNLFSVKCPSDIRGEGLVLKKAVGNRKTNLDIPVTDAVTVSGSCYQDGNQMMLRIPAAVLRDQFDMGEATLDLVFTGDIVATSPVP